MPNDIKLHLRCSLSRTRLSIYTLVDKVTEIVSAAEVLAYRIWTVEILVATRWALHTRYIKVVIIFTTH